MKKQKIVRDAKYGPILNKYPARRRDQLIPILQEIQDLEGYIPDDAYHRVADHLGIPEVKVNSVATFYNEFRVVPPGQFHLQVCQGMGCLVESSYELVEELASLLGIYPGEVTRDQMFSLEIVPCLGVCQVGPVISVNGKIYPEMNRKRLRDLIVELKNNDGK